MFRRSQWIIALGLGALACDPDDFRPEYPSFENNLAQLIGNDPDLSTFTELAVVAGLMTEGEERAESTTAFPWQYNGNSITILAPTNAAFAAVPAATLTALRADAAALRRVLLYHTLGGFLEESLIVFSRDLRTATGTVVNVRVSGETVRISNRMGSAQVVATNLRARNGLVHKIDAVLLPPPPPEPPVPGNLVEVASEAGLTSLVAAAQRAGLAETLSGAGPFTVFAPTNAAFGMVDTSAADPAVLANVLLTHVVAGEVSSEMVLAAETLTSLAGTPLAVAAGPPPTVGGVELSETLDVEASNGLAHVIGGVIVPPTILEVATATPTLSTLVAAVGRASPAVQAALDPDTLAGDAPITVFAPVNAAFTSQMIDPAMLDAAALSPVLSHHVVMGQRLSGDLTDGTTLMTLNGPLEVSVVGGEVRLTDGQGNEARVTTANIRTLTGVVHLIDRVLLPADPEPLNLVEIATEAGLTTLVEAASAAGLAGTLSGPGPFTVFAPTNEAFAALGVDLRLLNPRVLANVLLTHVVAGEVSSADVLAATSLPSVAGTPLAVVAGPPPTVGGARLSMTLDVEASNGIAHVINDVIVPPTILEVAAATPDLSTLVTAVGGANSIVQALLSPNVLDGDGPITVFAPTNAAFMAAGIDLATVGTSTLSAVLAHHIVRGQRLSTDLSTGALPTFNGPIQVTVAGGMVTLTDGAGTMPAARVTTADVRTLTGVVHIIDRVLIPAP